MAVPRLVASLLLISALAAGVLPSGSATATFLEPVELIAGPYRPMALTRSLDSRHVYATGFHGNTVSAWERDTATGLLAPFQTITDGMDDTVDGLDGARGAAVSGDGQNVYVAGMRDDSVAVFSRDVPTGGLAWINSHRDGIGGEDGLDGAFDVRVSNDGQQVYVAGFDEGALAVFSRAAGGDLTQLQTIESSDYFQASDVETTIGGFVVYVAAIGVRVLSRDLATGLLTEIDALESLPYGLFSSDSLAVSPDGRHLYGTDWYSDRVVTFAIDGATGTLSYLGHVDGGATADGSIHASRLVVSSDGARVFVVRSFEKEVAVYLREPSTGALVFEERHREGDPELPEFNVTDVSASPDGGNVYATVWATSQLLGGIEIFAAPSEVTFAQRLTNGFGGVQDFDTPTGIAVSPDGRHVYATAAASGSIAHFTRLANGTLAFEGADAAAPAGASAVAMDASGENVLVTGSTGGSVVLFTRDPATGVLSERDTQRDGDASDWLGGARAVALSPDGHFAYVAAPGDDAVSVFRIGAQLGFEEAELAGSGRLGLAQVVAVAVSPDGAHVYTASDLGEIGIFARSDAEGTLECVDGVEGVDGLDGARAIAVSPDGFNVYVASASSDAIAVFERDGSGALSPLETERGGLAGWSTAPPGGPVALAFSADGTQLFATDADDGSLVRFEREPAGTLRFVELELDRAQGLGIAGAAAVATSADGRSVYVAGQSQDALLRFTIPEPSAAAPIAVLTLLAFARRCGAARAPSRGSAPV